MLSSKKIANAIREGIKTGTLKGKIKLEEVRPLLPENQQYIPSLDIYGGLLRLMTFGEVTHSESSFFVRET